MLEELHDPRMADRVAQRLLATRLSPAPVTVSGELPLLDGLGRGAKAERDRALTRARYSIALTALADECATVNA